jgi:hypothetical protein
MAKSCEELYIGKIESGIRSIRFGTKTPKEAEVGIWLNKLKPLNIGQYDELFSKYEIEKFNYEERQKKFA